MKVIVHVYTSVYLSCCVLWWDHVDVYHKHFQVTLTGVTKRGYKILHKKSDGNESTLAVCKRHLIVDGLSDSDSCCTLKVVLLDRGDAVFVREEADNTGANYSKSHSYFGLIRLGTLWCRLVYNYVSWLIWLFGSANLYFDNHWIS